MPDKRSYRRFSLDNSIFLQFENDPAKTVEGKLLDISFTGVSVFVKESVDAEAVVQTAVQFDMQTFTESHLFGKGRVVQVKRHRMYAQEGFRIGVEFIKVDKEIVLSILDRLESIILEQIRRKNQAPRKDPGLF